MAEAVLAVEGMVDLREMITGRRNVHVEVVGTSTTDITRITDAIHDIGLQIESSELIRQRWMQPFNHFHYSTDEDDPTAEDRS